MTIGRTLSKSDFTLARTCAAKLSFLEHGYPDNRQSDPYLRLLAEGGYMVEALAMAKRPGGILVEPSGDHALDFERTTRLLDRDQVTLFQGTFIAGRRLVRVDVLEKSGDSVRLVEVKAKSIDGAASFRTKKRGGIIAEWRPKLEEMAYQTIVVERALPGKRVLPVLVLVDKSKRSTVNDLPRLFTITRRGERVHTVGFTGTPEQLAALDLLIEVDVSAEVALLHDEIEEAAARYESQLDAEFDPSMAAHSADCKRCEFNVPKSGYDRCWGSLADVDPHVLDLFSVGKVELDGAPLVQALFARNTASLLDVPEWCLAKDDGTVGPTAERQRRQIHHTRTGETWVGPQLGGKVSGVGYPMHFIDFEASRLALPYHAGMRPYGQVAFQWSCHTVASPNGTPRHREWLNSADDWPNHRFALALRDAIGDDGPVLTWSKFERSSLRDIIAELPVIATADSELARWVDDVADRRLVDLNEWASNDFYHPLMRGRTSIKVVLDALWQIDPHMREQFTSWTGLEASASEDPYHALPAIVINGVEQEVREGTGAVRAYEAMMYGVERGDEAAKGQWRALLREYCKLDTLSMVLIFEYWRRLTITP
jgi:hypothetical protein